MTVVFISIPAGSKLSRWRRARLEKAFKVKVHRKITDDSGVKLKVEGKWQDVVKLNQEARS